MVKPKAFIPKVRGWRKFLQEVPAGSYPEYERIVPTDMLAFEWGVDPWKAKYETETASVVIRKSSDYDRKKLFVEVRYKGEKFEFSCWDGFFRKDDELILPDHPL